MPTTTPVPSSGTDSRPAIFGIGTAASPLPSSATSSTSSLSSTSSRSSVTVTVSRADSSGPGRMTRVLAFTLTTPGLWRTMTMSPRRIRAVKMSSNCATTRTFGGGCSPGAIRMMMPTSSSAGPDSISCHSAGSIRTAMVGTRNASRLYVNAQTAAGPPPTVHMRMRSYARARIDLFAEDLFGEAAPRDPEPSDGGFRGPEPFFSDARHQCWQVVARPGDTKFNGLRHDDLIVQRSPDGTASWRCVPASALDPRKIFVRGADGAVRDDVVVLRRVRRRRIPLVDEAESGEVVEVPASLGPNEGGRSEQEIGDAVVARATAEWNAWHSTAGAPRPEGDAGMFGRLVGYYLAATGQILPDTLIAAQTAALAANYGT